MWIIECEVYVDNCCICVNCVSNYLSVIDTVSMLSVSHSCHLKHMLRQNYIVISILQRTSEHRNHNPKQDHFYHCVRCFCPTLYNFKSIQIRKIQEKNLTVMSDFQLYEDYNMYHLAKQKCIPHRTF